MTLNKVTVWDDASKCYVCLVDYGIAVPEPETTEATEALVFMVVGLTGHWKHPITYVLQDKCSADVQMQFIKDCIVLLQNEDMQVSFTNQYTAIKLGCKMTVLDGQTWLHHPERPSSKVNVVFDECHMIKLMWNLLGDYKTICCEENGLLRPIRWQCIEGLNDVQENLGFSLANKLKKKHIVWEKHKMNVKVAVQTLSASVADSLDFLHWWNCSSWFYGKWSHIRVHKENGCGIWSYEQPPSSCERKKQSVTHPYFKCYWAKTCGNSTDYIYALKDERGNLLWNGWQKTVIWGFAFGIQSVKTMAE